MGDLGIVGEEGKILYILFINYYILIFLNVILFIVHNARNFININFVLEQIYSFIIIIFKYFIVKNII